MSELTPYAKSTLGWLEKNLPTLVKLAMLQRRVVRWEGLFAYGDSIQKGDAVVYNNIVYMALRDNKDSVPKGMSDDWLPLVNLRTMKTSTEKFPVVGLRLPPKDNLNQTRSLASNIGRYAIAKAYNKALNEPIGGTHQWRGIFETSNSYSKGELVAFRHSVYIAESGNGIPGESKGWLPLYAAGSVGHGRDMNYLYDASTGNILTTEDGEPLVG